MVYLALIIYSITIIQQLIVMDETLISSNEDEIEASSKRVDLFEACIEQLNLPPESRRIKRLMPYLKTLTSFIQVLKNDNNNYHELLRQAALIMKHESLEENQMIMRTGQKGYQFYVLLSGKIAILTLRPTAYYLNDNEYVAHLLKLRRNEESEVIRQCMALNNRYCPFEDSFDQWMRNLVHFKENTGGRLVLFSDNKEIIAMVEDTLQYLKEKKTNSLSDSSITVEKYIASNQLDYPDNLPEGRKAFQILDYQCLNQIETGQTFGNVALESKSSKRTATLITLQHSELGVIDKAEYDLLIKTVNDKAKKKFYSIIFSFSIYQEISRAVFEKKYFQFFVYKKLERGEKLIAEYQKADFVYFLFKGEFELASKKNIVEVNALIISLRRQLASFKKNKGLVNTLNKEEEDFEEKKENEDLIINKNFRQPEHNKILFEKKQVKLGVIEDRDIIGLIDCIEPKTKIGHITCTCISNNSEVYSIPQQLFDVISWNESYIRPNLRQFQEKKINYMIQRLLNHKEMVKAEIAKRDLDLSKLQQIENDYTKSLSIKNRFYNLEANSIFKSKPTLKSQVLPIIPSLKGSHAHNGKTSRIIAYKNFNLKQMDMNSAPNRKKSKCLYLQDYQKAIIQKNLYNNLFHSYLKTEETSQIRRIISDNSFNEQLTTHSRNVTDVTKELTSGSKCLETPSKTSVNVIDCLIMDKFNKCYITALKTIGSSRSKNN